MITLKTEMFRFKYISFDITSIGRFKEHLFIEFPGDSIVLLFY